MNKLKGERARQHQKRVGEPSSNSRLPKFPLLDPNLLKQRLLLTPLIPGALVFLGYASDLLLPFVALQSSHKRDESRRTVKSCRKFCAGPLCGVRVTKVPHGLDGLVGHPGVLLLWDQRRAGDGWQRRVGEGSRGIL